MEFLNIADQMRPILHLSNEEIAAKLGCAVRVVQQRRHRIAIESAPALPTAGWPADAKAWTLEQVRLGESAGDISTKITQLFPTVRKSRNAVIGIAHRAGISLRGWDAKRGGKKSAAVIRLRRKAAAKPPQNPATALRQQLLAPATSETLPEINIPVSERIPLLVRKADGKLHANEALTDSACRWPLGEVGSGSFGFCGKPTIPGISWCEGHARRGFDLSRPLRRPSTQQPASPPPTFKVFEENFG